MFALASEYESFGNAAAEAAAAGVRQVVMDRCGMSDLLGEEASLVVPFDQAAVRAAIAGHFGEPELRARLAARAHAVAAEWSWPRVVELQHDIYRHAVERG